MEIILSNHNHPWRWISAVYIGHFLLVALHLNLLFYIWGTPYLMKQSSPPESDSKVMTQKSEVFRESILASASSTEASSGFQRQQFQLQCPCPFMVLAVQTLVSVPRIMFLDTELSLSLQPSNGFCEPPNNILLLRSLARVHFCSLQLRVLTNSPFDKREKRLITLKNSLAVCYKVKFTYHTISLLGIYPQEMKTYVHPPKSILMYI